MKVMSRASCPLLMVCKPIEKKKIWLRMAMICVLRPFECSFSLENL